MHRHQLRRNAQLEFHTPVGHRLCVAMAIAVMACTGADRSRAPSGGNAASVGQPTIGQRAGPHPIPALVPHPLPPVSPHPVVWSEASLAAALTSADFQIVSITEPVHDSLLTAAGAVLVVRDRNGTAEIHAFYYGGGVTIPGDLTPRDTLWATPVDSGLIDVEKATVVVDNNLLAIVLTANDEIREEIQKVLTRSQGR